MGCRMLRERPLQSAWAGGAGPPRPPGLALHHCLENGWKYRLMPSEGKYQKERETMGKCERKQNVEER
jgi:hypothetical protein